VNEGNRQMSDQRDERYRDDGRRDDRRASRESSEQQAILIDAKRRVLQNLLFEITRETDEANQERLHFKANTHTKIDWYLKAPSGYSKGLLPITSR
jgi:hypothetical protein